MKKVYIIHGWAYGLEKWDEAVDRLKDNDIMPIMLEVPGLTKESKEIWSIEDYVNWLDQQLAKVKEPVVLIGHSNGGRIALNYTLKHPKKIQQLILLDSAGVYHNDLKIRLKRFIFKALAKIGRLFSKSQKLRKLLYRLAREKDYHDAPENMRLTMANMLESDKYLVFGGITVPTAIIWGEEDSVTPIEDAHKLKRSIKSASLEVIKGARHSPHHTHPVMFVNAVKKALQ